MSKSIAQIKEEFAQAGPQGLPALYAAYGGDPRTGVQNLIKQYRKKEEALRHECERLEQMKTYERQHADCALICGIDEGGDRWPVRWWPAPSSFRRTVRSCI